MQSTSISFPPEFVKKVGLSRLPKASTNFEIDEIEHWKTFQQRREQPKRYGDNSSMDLCKCGGSTILYEDSDDELESCASTYRKQKL
eukprot:755503-Hanusia_phi.AAC.3